MNWRLMISPDSATKQITSHEINTICFPAQCKVILSLQFGDTSASLRGGVTRKTITVLYFPTLAHQSPSDYIHTSDAWKPNVVWVLPKR